MWIAVRETINPGFCEKLVISQGGHALSFAEMIAGWREDEAFRAFYLAELAVTPYPAFFWEMPPIRNGRANAPYECMLIRSDALTRMPPDTEAFASQFDATVRDVATFPNLGNDAMLVAPRQIAPSPTYAHLAAFLRAAPDEQKHLLFQALGESIDNFLAEYDRRVWISTSGLGIAWLHIRLDTYPKYYQHRPYAQM